MDSLFIFLQRIAPQKLISRIAGVLANSKARWWKSIFIRRFIRSYGVNMSEALEEDPTNYANFNDFFTRELKADARPITAGKSTLACPADGAVSQIGDIAEGKIFQAKNHFFTTAELLGGNVKLAEKFEGGKYTTIYLSPKDYHRVHMPVSGTLESMTFIPGQLFSVNPVTTNNVPGLFALNERMVALFDTDIGPVAVVMVGAMIVGSIETVWAGTLKAEDGHVSTTEYENGSISIEKGNELGRFKLGSTAILLFPKNTINWESKIAAGSAVQMGQKIGSII